MVKTARPYVFLFPAILIMLTSASCASNNLTRGKARDVICAQAVFVFGMDQPASYTLYGAAIERGVKAGFFRWESSLSGQVLILTDNGKRLFAEAVDTTVVRGGHWHHRSSGLIDRRRYHAEYG
jgi:hypothetical protein